MERLRAYLALAVVLGTLAAAPLAVAAGTPSRHGEQHALTVLPALNAGIVARINAVRVARGLHRLTVAAGLGAAARLHTREMALTGLFQHESPDGAPFWRRVRRFYGNVGFHSWSVGETLVWQSPTATAAEIVTTWLDSPPHREILLDPSWREIGVAALEDTAAPGDFEGLAAAIVTADFGARAR